MECMHIQLFLLAHMDLLLMHLLLSPDCYNDFVCCGREAHKEGSVKRLQELVNELPVVHFHTLAFLIRHLKKVETLSKKNKVSHTEL